MERRNAPRCLVFYPWYLDRPSGALEVLLAYSRALRDAGFRLDCFAPRKFGPPPEENGLAYGVFDTVYLPPTPEAPLRSLLDVAARFHADPQLPAREGRDESAMIGAALLAAMREYDLVGVHYTRCHTLAAMLQPGIRKILFTYDLDAVVAKQAELVSGRPAPGYTLGDEVSRFKSFDLVTVLGPKDMEAVRTVAPSLNVVEAPFVVTPHPVPEHVGDPPVLLWLSSLSTFHGVSFEWFWDYVWPLVREAHPTCRLIVAGEICQLARMMNAAADDRVELAGFVDDTGPLFTRATVLAAPYYYGAGVKVKVLDALARGIPVVTTSHGLTNTRLEPGRHVLVADEADGLAACILDLLGSLERRRSLRTAGLDYIRAWHDPSAALVPFQRAAWALVACPAPPGAVLGATIEDALKYLLPWTVDRCRAAHAQSVALFGAGSHTRLLLRTWDALGGPPVSTIVTSAPSGLNDLQGIPVVPAADFEPSSVAGIVLSSREFEGEMAEICAGRWPGLKVFPVWRPLAGRWIPSSGQQLKGFAHHRLSKRVLHEDTGYPVSRP